MRGYDDEILGDDNLLRSIKEQKQHAEKGVQELLKHFSEEGKYFDDLRYLGSKYQSRIKEFQNLVAENSDLKLETRKLQDQLNLLRSSLQDSGFREEDILNRISVDRGRPESTINALTNQSSREAKKSKLEEINKMKQQARSEQSAKNKEYQTLMESVLHFLETSYNTKALLSQIRPEKGVEEDSDEQMVRVPKKRYELLIEMYAMNMADLQAKKFQRQLQSKKQIIENLQKESERQLQEKYIIMKEENLQTGNLEVFFKRLSERLGFEKEWERYHLYNTEEAVNLYSRLHKIINDSLKRTPESLLSQDDSIPKENSSSKQLTAKIDQVVDLLPFSKKEKESWSKLSQKIIKDELIDMSKIFDIFKAQKERSKNELISQFSDFLHSVLTEMLTKFDRLLSRKTNNPERSIINLDEFKRLTSKDTLAESLNKNSANSQTSGLSVICISLMKDTLQKIFQKLQKHFKFLANRDILASLAQKE